ncbi:hypothetical protein XENOCAPTIV_023804 [Xenoophorus captivus]|uniref:Secreted protein n=1 Tax=Xenoophorus captivus TaxID=1517983 RepID=A0ABV0RNW8_9TELE
MGHSFLLAWESFSRTMSPSLTVKCLTATSLLQILSPSPAPYKLPQNLCRSLAQCIYKTLSRNCLYQFNMHSSGRYARKQHAPAFTLGVPTFCATGHNCPWPK